VISASLLLSMFTFFNQFDQPLVNTLASTKAVAPDTIRYLQQLGILGIMVQTALLTGVVLYLINRFTLPLGSITLLAGLNGALLASLEQHFDLMLWLRPGPQRVVALRVAAFIGPVAVSSLYLLFLQVTRGIGWPITLWLGSIIVSGAIGVLLSYLSVHPPIPRVDIA
jgi:hypothetical protein